MYRFSIVTLLVLFHSFLSAQDSFDKIDQKAMEIPASLRSHEQIAEYLTEGLETDREKIRAIYTWIATNIEYDIQLLQLPIVYGSPDELVQEVLQNRKGVCQHFAEIFHAMCSEVGISSKVISGYTIKNQQISNLGHAWNVVALDSSYFFVDPTWAAGYVENNRFYKEFRDGFFLVEPQEFILTHIPFDPLWQFLKNPISHFEVEKHDFSSIVKNVGIGFKDSILQFENEDEISQMIAARNRISKSGITNPLIKQHIDEISIQISGAVFNRAVDTLNFGVEYLNRYIDAKNNLFELDGLGEEESAALLEKAAAGIHASGKMLEGLVSANHELNTMIASAKRQISKLKLQLEKEELFLENYLE